MRCLEAAFGRDGRVSVGWVNGQLQKAGEAALAILQKTELRESVREAAIDELFRHRQPILCVIDPQTLLATVPQEARCYEAMEQVEQARRLIDAPRLLSSARMQARVEHREKAAALDERLLAFDWIVLIVDYLHECLTAYDARQHEIRTRAGAEAMIDEALGLLKEVELMNTRPLISMIENARPGLLTFLTVLEEKRQRIEVRWRYVTGSRPAAFNAIARAWYHRPRAHQSKRGQLIEHEMRYGQAAAARGN